MEVGVDRFREWVDRLTAGTAFGNVSVGMRPRAAAVRSTSAPHVARTVPEANSTAAEWRQPMEVAPRSVQMTAPPARATLPRELGIPVRHVPTGYHEPVVRPTTLIHSGNAPSQPVRFTPHEAVVTQAHPAPSAAGAPHTRGRPTTEPVTEAGITSSEATLTGTAEGALTVKNEVPVSYKFKSDIYHETPVYWKSPVGTEQTYKVFQRKDINWNQIRTDGPKEFRGKTNLEAAKAGLAPQLQDGFLATIHHLGQDSRGSLVEASRRYHGVGRPGQNVLHSQYGSRQPHPEYPVNHSIWQNEARAYWKKRVENIE